jgi:hypothetical protein
VAVAEADLEHVDRRPALEQLERAALDPGRGRQHVLDVIEAAGPVFGRHASEC